jgi:hypothetical protein
MSHRFRRGVSKTQENGEGAAEAKAGTFYATKGYAPDVQLGSETFGFVSGISFENLVLPQLQWGSLRSHSQVIPRDRCLRQLRQLHNDTGIRSHSRQP